MIPVGAKTLVSVFKLCTESSGENNVNKISDQIMHNRFYLGRNKIHEFLILVNT